MEMELGGRIVNLDGLRLMGAHEIRLLLGGINRQRVYALAAKDHFPKPVAELRQGKIWLGDDIDDWVAERRPPLMAPTDEGL